MSLPRPPISTHILDTSIGKAADGVQVTLYKFVDKQWQSVSDSFTNTDGRCANLISREIYSPGRYKLHFDVDNYFKSLGTASLYPFIEIVFDCNEASGHYHIPLLLNPFGYTTYRGT